LLVVLIVGLAGCEHDPAPYPPPFQRHPVEGVDPVRASMMVNMSDDDATTHFVRDIGPALEGGSWRWAKKRPTVKILLVKTSSLKLAAEYTIWDGAMKQTGPVTVSFFVGARDPSLEAAAPASLPPDQRGMHWWQVGAQHSDTPGYKHFETPVKREILQTASETYVAAEIDKLYVAPDDGAQFGFILTSMGFVRE
jgi:hypothetical protein